MYNIVYQPGETNPADYRSRHPTSRCDITGREAKMADEYVNFIVVNAVSKDITVDEVEQATLKDNVLQQDHSTTCFNKIILQRASTRSFYNVLQQDHSTMCATS